MFKTRIANFSDRMKGCFFTGWALDVRHADIFVEKSEIRDFSEYVCARKLCEGFTLGKYPRSRYFEMELWQWGKRYRETKYENLWLWIKVDIFMLLVLVDVWNIAIDVCVRLSDFVFACVLWRFALFVFGFVVLFQHSLNDSCVCVYFFSLSVCISFTTVCFL